MRIGEASRASGLPSKTIRYYEEIGLLSSKRLTNGYRDYSATDIQELCFLRRARDLGFSIEDCRSLVALHNDPQRASMDVQRVARHRLAAIDQQLADLESMRKTLLDLVADCPGDQSSDCSILEGLEEAAASR